MSQQLVAQIKSQLEAQGVDLSGPCGAFKITQRVAWALRHEGYGFLGGKTPAQNGCAAHGDKFAVDWILKADGHGVDILIDAGGQNGPLWAEDEAPAQFYRPAFDPGDVPGPVPVPIPTPTPPAPVPPAPLPPPPVDLGPVLALLAEHDEKLALVAMDLQDVKARQDRPLSGKIPYLGTITLKPQG